VGTWSACLYCWNTRPEGVARPDALCNLGNLDLSASRDFPLREQLAVPIEAPAGV
jgi:hypothetical protein